MKYLILAFLFSAFAQAGEYHTNNQTCYGFPRIAGMKTPEGTCVGLVASSATIPWEFPRKILFVEGHAYVSAYGGWTKKNNGQLWRLDMAQGHVKATQVLRGTDRTHGLRRGPDGLVYYGDATSIYRFHPATPHDIETVLTGKPDSYKGVGSNHPLSEFLFLDDGSLVLNVGAPSNDCKEEYAKVKACFQRDEQAELRLYKYNPGNKQFDPNFIRLAKGLRNSMGLLHNPRTGELYQVENAADAPKTPDEFNIIDLNRFNPSAPFDFGWPYCFGMSQRYAIYPNFKTFCGSKALSPAFLLPAHAAPLDMIYYKGRMFPELTGKILIPYHGHQPSGSRVAVVETNSDGQPLGLAKEYFVDGWQADPSGRFPKGAPVGIAEDENGALFVVDDKNHALLVIASTTEKTEENGNVGPGEKYTDANLSRFFSSTQLRVWDGLFQKVFVKTDCQSCHGAQVNNQSSRDTLARALNKGWLQEGVPYDEQVLWNRLRGEKGMRRMPPPGSEPVDVITMRSLKAWLGGI